MPYAGQCRPGLPVLTQHGGATLCPCAPARRQRPLTGGNSRSQAYDTTNTHLNRRLQLFPLVARRSTKPADCLLVKYNTAQVLLAQVLPDDERLDNLRGVER